MTNIPIELAVNKLLAANTNATLATIMLEDSTPFASWVPYVQAQSGTVLLLLSELAQHTKNTKQNADVSLLITSNGHEPLPDLPRITIQGKLQHINSDSELVQRYLNYFPQGKEFVENLDFSFYQVILLKLQAIMGFGEVQWFDGGIIDPSPFTTAEELHMTAHMNSDHADAIRHYCDKVSIDLGSNSEPKIVGINAHGFHVRVQQQLHWFAFETPCENVKSVREALISMARS